MPTRFDIRLRAHTPGGPRGSVLPTQTLEVTAPGATPSTLTAAVTERVYGALPNFLEVAVEYRVESGEWKEPRNGRMLVKDDDSDTLDVSKTHQLVGMNLWFWLLAKNCLAPADDAQTNTGRGRVAVQESAPDNSATTLWIRPSNSKPYRHDGTSWVEMTAPTLVALAATVVTTSAAATVAVSAATASDISADAAEDDAKSSGNALLTAVGMPTTTRIIVQSSSPSGANANALFLWVRETDSMPHTFNGASWVAAPAGASAALTYTTDAATARAVRTTAGGLAQDAVDAQAAAYNAKSAALAESGLIDPDAAQTIDNIRTFAAATPGAIVKTVVDEAQARGWGPALTYDFDADVDSEGNPWAVVLTMGYRPGTRGFDILQNLLDQEVVDVATEGRVLRLFNYGHGVDRSGEGVAPLVRVGATASKMPTKRTLDDLATAVAFYGDNGFTLNLDNPAAPTNLGRLEVAVQQGGVSDPGTATVLGQQPLQRGSQIRQQITSNDNAETASFFPWEHYDSDDWISGRYKGEWERLRVAALVVTKTANGAVTIASVLNDRFLDAQARLAKRTAGIIGGALAGGTGAIPNTTPDLRRPKPPVGLVVASEGYWSDGGVPLSQISATWSPVTHGENDVAIDVALYEMWGRLNDGVAESKALTTSVGAIASWSPFTPQESWLIKVCAQSKAGVWSEFSDEVAVTTQQPTEDLEKPTAPFVTTYSSLAIVTAPGTFDTDPPSLPPSHFKQWDVLESPSETGDYILVGILHEAGQQIPLSREKGSSWWYRIVAEDRLGRRSTSSDATPVTIVGVDGAQLIVDTLEGNRVKAGTITARELVSDIGEQLGLASALEVSIIAGSVASVAAAGAATAASLATTQTALRVKPSGVEISNPGGTFYQEFTGSSTRMMDGPNELLTMAGGGMTAKSVKTTTLIVGNHTMGPGVTGTIMNPLT